MLDWHLARRGRDASTRERLLVAKGWIALEQEGASETVRQILAELMKAAPKTGKVRALVEAVRGSEGAAG